jgi:hypothetical protein
MCIAGMTGNFGDGVPLAKYYYQAKLNGKLNQVTEFNGNKLHCQPEVECKILFQKQVEDWVIRTLKS